MIRPLAVLHDFVGHLERLGVPYAIGGSLASGLHGEPRSTHDFDLLTGLLPGQVPALLAVLRPDYYVDEASIREALARHAAFNVIHLASGQKIDVFVSSGVELDQEQMERRVRTELVPGERPLAVTSAEVILLRKLDWFRRGGESSQRQLRDIVSVLRTQRGRLDERYLDDAAARFGLSALLARARKEAERGS